MKWRGWMSAEFEVISRIFFFFLREWGMSNPFEISGLRTDTLTQDFPNTSRIATRSTTRFGIQHLRVQGAVILSLCLTFVVISRLTLSQFRIELTCYKCVFMYYSDLSTVWVCLLRLYIFFIFFIVLNLSLFIAAYTLHCGSDEMVVYLVILWSNFALPAMAWHGTGI
jgi:hypothetical protein